MPRYNVCNCEKQRWNKLKLNTEATPKHNTDHIETLQVEGARITGVLIQDERGIRPKR